jgi:hypothetical protein
MYLTIRVTVTLATLGVVWIRCGFWRTLKLKSSLRELYGRHHDLVDRYEYLCHKWPRYIVFVVNTFRSFPRSWLITGFVSRLTQRVSLVEQELLTLPKDLSSPPVFSGVRVTRSLVWYIYIVDPLFVFLNFSFVHCVVCSSSIYRLWLPLWYLQTLLKVNSKCWMIATNWPRYIYGAHSGLIQVYIN